MRCQWKSTGSWKTKPTKTSKHGKPYTRRRRKNHKINASKSFVTATPPKKNINKISVYFWTATKAIFSRKFVTFCYWLDISIRADTIRLTCTQPSFPLLWSERLHEVFILLYLFVKINSLKCWTCVSTADILSYHDQYILRTLETSWRWKLRTSKIQQIR